MFVKYLIDITIWLILISHWRNTQFLQLLFDLVHFLCTDLNCDMPNGDLIIWVHSWDALNEMQIQVAKRQPAAMPGRCILIL